MCLAIGAVSTTFGSGLNLLESRSNFRRHEAAATDGGLKLSHRNLLFALINNNSCLFLSIIWRTLSINNSGVLFEPGIFAS